ncbi:hypothetical protein [Peribacillus sp. AS_2]|nr:hypothetical protein [Peribacillus sp. AS_2]MCZ0874955.1 hypothetical protein [Peribacillus sp. AS_2]
MTGYVCQYGLLFMCLKKGVTGQPLTIEEAKKVLYGIAFVTASAEEGLSF